MCTVVPRGAIALRVAVIPKPASTAASRGRAEFAAGGNAPRTRRLAHRTGQEIARLGGQPENLALGLAGPAPEDPGHRPQPAPDRSAPVADVASLDIGRVSEASRGAGEQPGTGRRKAGIGRVADVGLDDRGVDPDRAGAKAALPGSELDHAPDQLGHELGPEAAGHLAHGRLVGHRIGERDHADQAEAPQVERIGHLARERLVSPAGACLEHHQPDVAGHRDRRPPFRLGGG